MLAFVHIRKTGGSTIDMILRQSFGSSHFRIRLGRKRSSNPIATATEIRRCRWIYWKMKCISGHGIVPHSDLDSLERQIRYFTFLREPLTRCASDYQFRVTRGGLKKPFHEWVRSEIAANQQTLKIAGVPSAEAAIEMIRSKIGFVGVLERFEESLVLFEQWAKEPSLDIRYRAKNVAANSRLKRQLLSNPQTLGLLREANQEDLKLYRYVVDEHLVEATKAYQGDLKKAVGRFREANDPPPVLPRQLGSMLLREVVYKPLANMLRNPANPPRRFRPAA